jgi:hypothetical protein
MYCSSDIRNRLHLLLLFVARSLVTNCRSWHSRNCTEMLPGVYMTWLMFFLPPSHKQKSWASCVQSDKDIYTLSTLVVPPNRAIKTQYKYNRLQLTTIFWLGNPTVIRISFVMIWLLLQILLIGPSGLLKFRSYFWNYESFRHLVGFLGRESSDLSQGLYLHKATQHRKTRTYIHGSRGIWSIWLFNIWKPVDYRIKRSPIAVAARSQIWSWPLEFWYRGFESHLKHGYISASFCVALSATRWPLSTESYQMFKTDS